MTTKSEAAEALYRAAKPFSVHVEAVYERDTIDRARANLRAALDAYSSAPPDAPPSLPPAVQRVVEAAARWHYAPEVGPALAAHCEMRDAIKAYCERVQFTQPEPLSARLAKVKLGSVVEDEDDVEFLVFANHTLSRTLVCDHADGSNGEPLLVPYERVVTIIYESP